VTDRDVFERVRGRLLVQGRRAAAPNCRYRLAGDGVTLRCAVGCLIADEHYDDGFENRPVAHQAVIRALSESGVLESDDWRGPRVRMLTALQYTHDESAPAAWAAVLDQLSLRLSPEGSWTGHRGDDEHQRASEAAADEPGAAE